MAKQNIKQDNLQLVGSISAAIALDIGDINSRLFMVLEELGNPEPDMQRIKDLTVTCLKKLPYPNQVEIVKYC